LSLFVTSLSLVPTPCLSRSIGAQALSMRVIARRQKQNISLALPAGRRRSRCRGPASHHQVCMPGSKFNVLARVPRRERSGAVRLTSARGVAGSTDLIIDTPYVLSCQSSKRRRARLLPRPNCTITLTAVGSNRDYPTNRRTRTATGRGYEMLRRRRPQCPRRRRCPPDQQRHRRWEGCCATRSRSTSGQ
jgi:hypothetical protein